ncbi:MAG: hypothetical protein GY854_02970 [Deltaproteobacteria bacterium]|nr:hypothetical protein [Deltaproteobacteria bacterium]
MRQTNAFLVIASLALLMAGCFYDPDRSKISEDETDSGLGEDCTEDECTGDADYCMPFLNICTIENCDEMSDDSCPSLYTCCSCSDGTRSSTVCIPDDKTELSETTGACDCS